MRSVEARFRACEKARPNHGAFIAFGDAIRGQSFAMEVVREWFLKLVPAEDYDENALKSYWNHFELMGRPQ